jgi:hypothetical protein
MKANAPLAVGGVARYDAALVGRVEGKVVDSAGRAVVSADITVPGTALRAFSDQSGKFVIDSVPAGQRQVLARRIGYVAQEVPVVVKEQSAVATNITMTPMTAQLEESIVSGIADKPDARAPGMAISVLKKDTSATMRREVYEVSPGVKVTLVDSLIGVAAEKDLKTRMEARAAPTATSAPASVMNAAASDVRINTISWTDGNHHYTLSGPLAPKELEEIKHRIMKLRR